MTPEELIQQLGPGTDGAVCVQKLLDQVHGVKAHVVKALKEDEDEKREHEKGKDEKEKEEKPVHTPYRTPPKHG